MSRPITGTIRGSFSELTFDPMKANRFVNVWFRCNGDVWFGVGEPSEFTINTPSIDEHLTDGDHWVASCEIVGDCWLREIPGDPYGFELTDIGDSALDKHREAIEDLKEKLSDAFASLVGSVGNLINRFSGLLPGKDNRDV